MSLENAIFDAKADLLDRIGTDDEVNAEGAEIRVDDDGYHYTWYANTPKKKGDSINEMIYRCKVVARLKRHNGEITIEYL